MKDFTAFKNRIMERKTFLQNKRVEIQTVLAKLDYTELSEKGIEKVRLCNSTLDKIDSELLSLRFDYLMAEEMERTAEQEKRWAV